MLSFLAVFSMFFTHHRKLSPRENNDILPVHFGRFGTLEDLEAYRLQPARPNTRPWFLHRVPIPRISRTHHNPRRKFMKAKRKRPRTWNPGLPPAPFIPAINHADLLINPVYAPYRRRPIEFPVNEIGRRGHQRQRTGLPGFPEDEGD
ncbi:hypothetical protein SNE40_006797 [Patella caerulea]|uniref:Uncharacterized protein n=1 Tax=Patella caerulea TaxID=87958 RepID=A0AAN8JX76_PATCE